MPTNTKDTETTNIDSVMMAKIYHGRTNKCRTDDPSFTYLSVVLRTNKSFIPRWKLSWTASGVPLFLWSISREYKQWWSCNIAVVHQAELTALKCETVLTQDGAVPGTALPLDEL